MVDIHTMIPRDTKPEGRNQASLAATTTMTPRETRSATPIPVYSAVTITTMQRDVRLDTLIRVPLAATITMTAKVIRMGEVILFWVDTPTVTQMAAMLPPVSMDPMIHRRFGHSAVSGTIIWADAHGVVPLFGHTMP